LDRLHDAGFAPQAIDLPGFGKSEKCALPPEKVLQGFMAEQKLSRPVLVGPSMGGRISLDVALHDPESIGGLVLIGAGHPCYLDQPDLWHEQLLAFLKKHFT